MSDLSKLDPWQPESNPIRIAIMGKLLEELGELTAIVARCVIQGINESEPNTGFPNVLALQQEIADVYACVSLLGEHLLLNQDAMNARMRAKIMHLRRWHVLIN